jgi:NADPH:quinone reductase-like Zn-dependent oxidoreductase
VRGGGWVPRAEARYHDVTVFVGAACSLYFLRGANVKPGERVLVHGASGSLGVFAVQLAKHFGAHVTAVCSSANVHLVRSLGPTT